MKLYLLTLAISISAASFTASIAITPSAYANPKQTSAITAQRNQSANLVTEAATITSKWNNIVSDQTRSNDGSLRVSDPECKKINPLEYINNPETFFKPCSAPNDPNRQSYEPIEYLKVPKLDSGLSVTITNF
ncbi:hypothetical protein VB713_25830 [Anabaena cylindrica UHCC 0172]|uniref:hypothetical protein n=1 Tax=Anabaena cylindrica TaxID=1165 RepID=UPI002B1F07D2|nr:hypothetical protein [Anabaena cylindrica]MEA5554358.1 hypothetical protein [Anabaena cylindrica UHCC 0172]